MGGSSKKQTVGYRYRMGLHLVLCQGPVDAVQEIQMGERTAWGDADRAPLSSGHGLPACPSTSRRCLVATSAKAAWSAPSMCCPVAPAKGATTI
jgi:hypothetical protein